MTIKLVAAIVNDAGLGKLARDNVAAWWMRELCNKYKIGLQPLPIFHALANKADIKGMGVYCAITTTHLRNPGYNINNIAKDLMIDTSEMLVVHDDMAFQPGVVRFTSSSRKCTTHKGILSIEDAFNTKDFHRLRIGIGNPIDGYAVNNYLQAPPSLEDKEKIDEAIQDSIMLLPTILAGDWQAAKNHLNAPRMFF